MTCRRHPLNRPSLLLASLIGLAICSPALADGLIIVPDNPPETSPGSHAFAPLQVKRHHVNVQINGQVATTKVDQTFHNPTGRRLEGTYLFPLPKGAQIDNFNMNIGGERVEAKLLSADKARQIYERIVRQQKDPALLEYVGRGAFKVRIFPIEPHSNKRVTLKYTQLLKTDSGLVDYTCPLSTEKFSAEPIQSLSVKCKIKTNHALKTLYSPTHRVEVSRKNQKHALVGFETRDVTPDSDFQLLYSAPKAPKHGIAMNLLTHRGKHDKAGYYMLLASPGTDLTATRIAAKDVVFVVDTSGSMRGKKIAQARQALRYCVKNLNERDRFEIVRFSTEAEPLFDGLMRAGDDDRDNALRFIDNFKAVGGTAIHAALGQAVDAIQARQRMKGRPSMIVFLTDGRPTIGQIDEQAIVEAIGKAGGARVFSFGVGTDINTHLLDRVSNNTGAFTQYVLPDEQIDKKLTSFYRRIAHPVLTDLDLKVSGGVRLSRSSPRTLGNLFHGQQLIQFGRYDGHGDAAITQSGHVGDETVKLVRELSFPKHRSKHEFVPRL